MSWIALAIGGFYVFAGVVVLRALAMERLMDQVLLALGEEADATDALRLRILTVGGFLTLASGAALALLSPLASTFFIANAVLQGGYLIWAERAVPLETPDEKRGRRQTKNAFVIYAAATALVLWLQLQGKLRPWPDAFDMLALDAAVIAGVVAVCWAWLHFPREWSGAKKTESGGGLVAPLEADEAQHRSTRLRFAPEWQCWPLWDADTGDNLNPYELDLPLDLVERIERWDAAWQATYNADDPAASGFHSDVERATHDEEGRLIGRELRATWAGEVEIADLFHAPDETH